MALANAFREHFEPDASVVAISISTTRMASENYGYMAPIKAALDSSVVFLAKSFSATSSVRFNAVKAGPLKTSASAGIPGYLDNYLFAEGATLRHAALRHGRRRGCRAAPDSQNSLHPCLESTTAKHQQQQSFFLVLFFYFCRTELREWSR